VPGQRTGKLAVVVAVAAAAGVVLGAGEARAVGACDAQKRLRPTHRVPGRPAPLALGNSVMLGAAVALARAGFEVDARGCRQMGAGIDILAQRRRAGTLPPVVVVALGTNGEITSGDVRRALRVVGPRRLLVLVTPRELGGGSGADAAVVRAAGRRHPGRVRVADWVRYSAGRGSWFGGDGIHLGPAAAAGMVRMLRPYLRARTPFPAPCR